MEGYEAFDVKNDKLVYIKDSWCYIADGIEKEGDTYRLLMVKGVSQIPDLVCDGDVKSQETLTHRFIGERWCHQSARPSYHKHYRLVLQELGRPLSQYNSTEQLCKVLYKAIICTLPITHPQPHTN